MSTPIYFFQQDKRAKAPRWNFSNQIEFVNTKNIFLRRWILANC